MSGSGPAALGASPFVPGASALELEAAAAQGDLVRPHEVFEESE